MKSMPHRQCTVECLWGALNLSRHGCGSIEPIMVEGDPSKYLGVCDQVVSTQVLDPAPKHVNQLAHLNLGQPKLSTKTKTN